MHLNDQVILDVMNKEHMKKFNHIITITLVKYVIGVMVN